MSDASHRELSSQGAAGLVVHLGNSLAAVDDGRLALMGYLAPFKLQDKVINRLEVVLEELVSNVVRHSAGATGLMLEAEYQEGRVTLTIEDNGPPFDPLEVTMPATFTTLEDAKIGGLGIPLVKRLTQSLCYQRAGACNRISAVIAAA
jgi:serine/threonine-protein kinase RsbW